MEEELKVTWEGKPAKVVVGEIDWQTKMDCIKKSFKRDPLARSQKKESDAILQKELMMVASVKSASFTFNLENLRKLSSRDGEKIYVTYSKLNELNDDNNGDDEGEELSGTGSGEAASLIQEN